MVKIIQPGFKAQQLAEQFCERGYSPREVTKNVADIIEGVRRGGDDALSEYSRKFDKVEVQPGDLKVSSEDMAIASRVIDPDLLTSMEVAVERIRRYHYNQKQRSWWMEEPGGLLGQQVRAIERVGVYAPGGTAVLFSTAMMNIIPAQVAGCERIVVASPPQASLGGSLTPAILAMLQILGVHEVYRMGGAQAVAAMAYGTGTVPKVDMICGPGNIYVTEAKRQVQGTIRIDSLAGPSEVLVIADKEARADFIAADLLAQLEHDEHAAAMLVTPEKEIIESVQKEMASQVDRLRRKKIIEASLEHNCYLVLTRDFDEALGLANQVAPEHLELCVRDPERMSHQVQHAGAIFLGDYTPEAIGDYIAGPNHVLPTGRTARFSSGLSVDDFIKKSSLAGFEEEGFRALADAAMLMAQAEDLDAHANSIRIRL